MVHSREILPASGCKLLSVLHSLLFLSPREILPASGCKESSGCKLLSILRSLFFLSPREILPASGCKEEVSMVDRARSFLRQDAKNRQNTVIERARLYQ
jgi:hypothetical protein